MKQPKLLPVKSDIVFRLFFADERNREDLICFLKAILRLPDDDYDDVLIADPYLLPEYDDDKLAIKEADGTDLYDWAKFIAAQNEEELAMVAERNPQVEKAAVKLRKLSADEQARALYERREKARRDLVSQTKYALLEGEKRGLRKGRKEGIKEGMQKKAVDFAKILLDMADPVDKIMKVTGLTREEIEALRG